MKVSRLRIVPLNNAIAYLTGLMYPMTKISSDENYIYAVVASKIITAVQKDQHITNIFSFLEDYDMGREKIDIVDNLSHGSTNAFALKFRIDEDPIEILDNIVSEIVTSSDEIKKFFLKGCFDGRSSFDTNKNCISLSVDKSREKSNNILNIARDLSLDIENNKTRNKSYHQIRIKSNPLDYKREIGFFSVVRNELIR